MNLSSNGHVYLMATILDSEFLEATSPDTQAIALANTKSLLYYPRQKKIFKNSLMKRIYM